MDVTHYGERFERRVDPWGRPYYWATGEPPPHLGQEQTDLTALKQGFITLTPLDYNMTRRSALAEMQRWEFRWEGAAAGDGDGHGPTRRPIVAKTRADSKVT
jgi:5'-nucleotidase